MYAGVFQHAASIISNRQPFQGTPPLSDAEQGNQKSSLVKLVNKGGLDYFGLVNSGGGGRRRRGHVVCGRDGGLILRRRIASPAGGRLAIGTGVGVGGLARRGVVLWRCALHRMVNGTRWRHADGRWRHGHGDGHGNDSGTVGVFKSIDCRARSLRGLGPVGHLYCAHCGQPAANGLRRVNWEE